MYQTVSDKYTLFDRLGIAIYHVDPLHRDVFINITFSINQFN